MYEVLNGNTPFFRWRNNEAKAREGNIWAGYNFDGYAVGAYVVTNESVPGAQELPPFAFNKSDVVLVEVPPDTGGVEEPPTPTTKPFPEHATYTRDDGTTAHYFLKIT